jgi:hypothetical protein
LVKSKDVFDGALAGLRFSVCLVSLMLPPKE